MNYPIDEVTNRLKQLSTEKQLDLSALFLDSHEISEVIKTFQKSEIPQNSRICLDFCEISIEDESNLQCLIDECSDLRIMNTKSNTGFSGVFEVITGIMKLFFFFIFQKMKNPLMKLEMIGIDFRDESQIIKILKSCPNLKNLKISGIRISTSSIMDSVFPSAIHSLKHLVKLDLSFNASWISDQIWLRTLKELDKLEELTMNETKSDVQFESDWLPNLSSFYARGSDLHWDSIFELLSVLERITMIDIRYSTVDSTLPQELKAGKPMIEVLY
ncbi:hypothetical protein CAEBREN_30787 [Caenorhabditis brenneri]|uniref:DUF38 domain-containing protein n=1 Tax=Caenorhabditis brenneri TaxID=135651 RepID=G0NK57_CAEBE|nr:hypothetical protein CAEBREN_30787 [Caenorhabditis brenneri]